MGTTWYPMGPLWDIMWAHAVPRGPHGAHVPPMGPHGTSLHRFVKTYCINCFPMFGGIVV